MTDALPPQQDKPDRCHLAEARFSPLAQEIRDTRETLIALRTDMAHVRTSVDGLDKLVRGNGVAGLATQVQVHQQRLDDLAERVETHEAEDNQQHAAWLSWRRGLLAGVIVCLLGWVLTTLVALWRMSPAMSAPSPSPTPSPAAAASPHVQLVR